MTPISYIEDFRMIISNPSELGALIRDRRIKKGLDQMSLAQRAGTSRKWLIEVEQGKPRAAIGLILRTLRVLDVSLQANDANNSRAFPDFGPSIDINKHLEKLRKR